MKNYAIHWFRRDLRIQGNQALVFARRKYSGNVLGVFFFDSSFLARPDFSHNRFAFFIETLESLKKDLKAQGGDLLVLDDRPLQGFKRLVDVLEKSKHGKPSLVTWSRDYEPFALKRDQELTRLLDEDLRIPVHTDRDHLLIEPDELKKTGAKSGEEKCFYQVFTPFSKKWIGLVQSKGIQNRIEDSFLEKGVPSFSLQWSEVLRKPHVLEDQLLRMKQQNLKKVTINIPRAGVLAAQKHLDAFVSKVDDYDKDRDFPALPGTSKLSIFLKNGSLTVAQVISALKLHQKKTNGKSVFLKELIWREFYYHILYHRPQVETGPFLEKYKNLDWDNNQKLFEAWKEGKTGFPIVDAGMRQLKQTGWMHNRVRMIVASFLTKDLLIDWRWGERYFMQALLDGDLAPNNGGWQWAASTGCDPQPYFRIFNPELQSKRFDPEAKYIQKYVGDEVIAPIVDHSRQKLKALALFKK